MNDFNYDRHEARKNIKQSSERAQINMMDENSDTSSGYESHKSPMHHVSAAHSRDDISRGYALNKRKYSSDIHRNMAIDAGDCDDISACYDEHKCSSDVHNNMAQNHYHRYIRALRGAKHLKKFPHNRSDATFKQH